MMIMKETLKQLLMGASYLMAVDESPRSKPVVSRFKRLSPPAEDNGFLADRQAMAGDWQRVGETLQSAFTKAAHEPHS